VNLDYDVDALLERAIRLARMGTGRVEPNPRVGALVIRGASVVGEGYHSSYGGPHAEVQALRDAGEAARGADLLVTLEPCSTEGRTGPCTDAIIATGIRRVIFAESDPSAANGGRARAVLEEAGIEVMQLPAGDAQSQLIADFRTYEKGTLPWVVLKWAMTADGKVATVSGESRWISSEQSREEVHEERARCDAVLVGRATVKADDPELIVRLEGYEGRQPVRVVLDSGLHIEPTSKLAMTASTVPTWVFHCASGAYSERHQALEALGVRVLEVPPGEGGRLDPAEALRTLRREGLNRILVEGGPTVHGALVAGGLADWARVYVAPVIVGGITAPGPVAGPGFPSLREAVWLEDVHLRIAGRGGSDFVVEGRIGNHRES
jgi:diaminohydroxyphosphoribosylaminopyrimidine deaminase/5-amino-6-(5-phosphoribosylamino)uracil reductase